MLTLPPPVVRAVYGAVRAQQVGPAASRQDTAVYETPAGGSIVTVDVFPVGPLMLKKKINALGQGAR